MGDNKDSLGDRMKSYEWLSTSRQLMPNCPVYARIDGRAFHTLCKGLKKPYSMDFIQTMQEVCKYLVGETGAVLGYVQSDEISLGWLDYSKAPFEGRMQKLESVLASMASAKFVQYIEASKSGGGLHINDGMDRLWHSTQIHIPSFDCRVFNVPNEAELANCFLWRENDAIKNSISGMSLSFFSHKQLQNKNSDEKIAMMKDKGYEFYRDTDESFIRGTFFHREVYEKELSKDEVDRIPAKRLEEMVELGQLAYSNYCGQESYFATRSHIVQMKLPYRLTDTDNLPFILFHCDATIECNKESPTFCFERESDK